MHDLISFREAVSAFAFAAIAGALVVVNLFIIFLIILMVT